MTLLNGSNREPVRCRVSGKLLADGGDSRVYQHQSFGRDIGHAVAETYLITGLSFKLLRYLGCIYVFFLITSPRSIVYGDQPRNRLNLYLPTNKDGLKPAVIFVAGGAWIIGYKAWGSLLRMQLAERDIIVACLDYSWSWREISTNNLVVGIYV